MRRPWLMFSLVVCGCALLSKGERASIRYFSPDIPQASRAHSGKKVSRVLRLAQVKSADDLRERIAFRPSAGELQYYDNRSWTERPAAYLSRALSRALFEEHGFTMGLSGSAPTLAVELTAFEELREPPHRVRLDATMVIEHGDVALVYETFRVEPPVAADAGDPALAVADAFSQGLKMLVARIVERTTTALTQAQSPSGQEL